MAETLNEISFKNINKPIENQIFNGYKKRF